MGECASSDQREVAICSYSPAPRGLGREAIVGVEVSRAEVVGTPSLCCDRTGDPRFSLEIVEDLAASPAARGDSTCLPIDVVLPVSATETLWAMNHTYARPRVGNAYLVLLQAQGRLGRRGMATRSSAMQTAAMTATASHRDLAAAMVECRATRTAHPVRIQAARRAAAKGGAPIGAVIVDVEGALVAEGHSCVAPDCDPTSHAELNAVRKAARKLGQFHLPECTLYSTLEPC